MTLNSELQKVAQGCEQAKHRVRQLFEGLNEEQSTKRPDSRRWSIAECIAHLNLIGDIHLRVLDEAIERGLEQRIYAKSPFRYGWLSRRFVAGTEPPSRLKLTAPKRIQPVDFVFERLLPDFLKLQDEIVARVEKAAPLDLVRIKIPFQFFKLFRLNLGAYFEQAMAHERRHLWQAEQVRRELEREELWKKGTPAA
jgi:hypothetical protein